MLKKEDFKNPIDWVIYKVNGQKPEKREKQTKLVNNTISPAKRTYPLKFYKTHTDERYNVSYDCIHLCTCHESEIMEVQEFFDKNHDSMSMKEMSEKLKTRYNLKIKRNVSHPVKRSRIPRRLKTYKQNVPTFENKKTGRMQVRVMDKGTTHTLCSCYPHQREEVVSKYNSLKRTHELDDIKDIMKTKYNLRRLDSNRKNVHEININSNGNFFYDGKFIKSDEKLYKLIDDYINKGKGA